MCDPFLIDIGNTAIKWARSSSAGRLADTGYHKHDAVFSDETLDHLWGALPHPSSVWFASVADSALSDRLVGWVRVRWRLEPRQIFTETAAFGVVNSYRNAQQLGVDRWLALIAARARHKGACCVADLGTAATVDLLDVDGKHLGGLILPGVGMSRRALLEYTRIPWVGDIAMPTLPFGKDTAAAVALGGRYALAGVIERAATFLSAQCERPEVFVLGSEADAVMPFLDCAITKVPHLVLEGIGRYAGEG